MFKQLANQNFPEMEDEVTKLWDDKDIFQKSITNRSEDNPYSFVDGPPFVSGLPHYGHLLVSIAKDVVPRYWTMKGKRVRRVFGWDCHGLPIENKVNQKLNITSSSQLEREVGIDKYIGECKTYVEGCIEDWQWYIKKIGRWVDMEHAYKTMYTSYSESVVWAFKQIYDKKMIYKGKRVSLYSTDTATPVSSFEVAMDPDNYQDTEDLSVYVKFRMDLKKSNSKSSEYFKTLKYPVFLSAWTTTPWTLPSNFALAINKDETYAVVKRTRRVTFEKSAGCIVHKEGKFLVIHDRFGNISFPKGHIEKDESAFNASIREVKEETGYSVKIVTNLGKNTYQFYHGKESNELSHKELQFFLAELSSEEQSKAESKTEWLTFDELKEKFTHKEELAFVEASLDILKGKGVQPLNVEGKVLRENLSDQFEYLVMAEKLVPTLKLTDGVIVKKLKGEDLIGLAYEPLFDYFEGNENDFKVYEASFVGMEDGTGIVHIAPAFGEDDFNFGKKYKLSDKSDIDEEGKMLVGKYKGTYIRDASKDITNDLRDNDSLIKLLKYVHRLPYFRGPNPLIYVAQEAYFVDIQSIKKRMLTLNKKVNWEPEYIKEGRFAQTIETSPDWCISRNRYWATVMPIWVDTEGNELVVGSIDEIMKYSDQVVKEGDKYFFKDKNGNVEFTFHRDICDKIVLKKDGKEYKRIPEVLDGWMDSGSVPFAEHHYPFENKERFEKAFPADFIVEYVGQVRAWFSVLLRMSTMIFDEVPFKNVVVHGVMSGTDGRKMSKSLGNYPDAKVVLEKIGGDAIRMYLMGSSIMNGEDMDWSDDLLKKQVQNVLLPVYNTLKFFHIYAELHNYEVDQSIVKENGNLDLTIKSKNKLDKWIDSRLSQMIYEYESNMLKYDIPASVKTLQPFVEDLSTWYVRRSRDRFNSNDKESLDTLYKVLVKFSLAVAPIVPFLSEKIYQTLVVSQLGDKVKESVHLLDYPSVKKLTISQNRVVMSMKEVREVCNLIGSIRNDKSIKVKQALGEANFIYEERTFDKWELKLIEEEMNIKKVVQVDKFDKEGGNQVKIESSKLQLWLNTEITEELKVEGMVRELSRSVQSERKKKGLELKATPKLIVLKDSKVYEFVEKSKDELMKNCKLSEVSYSENLEDSEYVICKLMDYDVKFKLL